ncbi:NAD(P)/FAD-dependent oxidoreductase [Flagellimonas halotolerans]|uniref:Tryptophan 2-monooxygenase n=1 Tax=Flagellimonas halotolerans TaxID=3112164 RepID=A0ABU6IT36_9FLAO|nr:MULTISPECIES: NAD(P)/FAD-dependent oxidoreductase [unclassified Allomuricauda]MEC3966196.1 NAD(P)/FAD-dependent oxidoreductase [Muricauda sp. SYSU M86414]MEC4266118.1 NAD(P)/FAD-dependent oxidoreductase [Muricauda sp. SYSU M84420]
MKQIKRRGFIKNTIYSGLGASLIPSYLMAQGQAEMGTLDIKKPASGKAKKIIVAGAGISGLCCAYELMKKGHEVTVLEASGRLGGAVLSVHDGLADGLYADFGAENFTKPGYKNYWKYIEEFKLPVLPYHHREDRLTRIDGVWHTEKMQKDAREKKVQEMGGFNKNELKFLQSNPVGNLQLLYLEPYFEKFTDEYRPFGIGYDHLENIQVSQIYKKAGASKAAMSLLGGDQTSALYSIWQAYIMHKRGYDNPFELFRLKGGNQVLTNELGKRLGTKVKLGCQILEIEHNDSGVNVTYRELGEVKKISADYLACCLRTTALKKILFTPALPPQKQFIIDNIKYDQTTRIVFQARSKFWLKDNISINLSFDHPALAHIWQVADEVDTDRVCLMAKAPGGTNPLRTLEAFRELYPGNKSNIDIEQTLVKDWSKDTFVHGCERHGFSGLGELSKFWPHTMSAHGRIHFGGAHTDNRSWGMEAATNSANRVATEIDTA